MVHRKKVESFQLRLRLTAPEREALERCIVERSRNETISDVVREALVSIIHPEDCKVPYFLSKTLRNKVFALARLLNRNTDTVVEYSVQGILDLMEAPEKTPLIVLEARLRADYKTNRDEGKAAPH